MLAQPAQLVVGVAVRGPGARTYAEAREARLEVGRGERRAEGAIERAAQRAVGVAWRALAQPLQLALGEAVVALVVGGVGVQRACLVMYRGGGDARIEVRVEALGERAGAVARGMGPDPGALFGGVVVAVARGRGHGAKLELLAGAFYRVA